MENKLEVKLALYQKCEAFINKRLQNIQYNIAEIQESLMSETKSSAGDKHETGRAMLQLEREKFGAQWAEINQVKQAFSKINPSNLSETVCLGSVVYTSQANYFISISAGNLVVEDTKFFAIAPNTPIGLLIMGKKQNDTFIFRNNTITILDVL